MWDRNNGRSIPAKERLEYAQTFFNEVKSSEKAALVFYYCNYDNPVSGDDKKYALAGIARIKKVHITDNKEHPFLEWDDIPKDMEEKYGRFIWSCIIENDPAERIRLPYQEYVEMGKDPGDFAVFPEGELTKSFKYGAHHVSDDDAISIIDMTIVAVKKIINNQQDDAFSNACENWVLNKQDIIDIIQSSDTVSFITIDNMFNTLTCEYGGTIIINNEKYNFVVNAGSYSVIFNADTTIYLGCFEKNNTYFLDSVYYE
jgi:hypothetical protein